MNFYGKLLMGFLLFCLMAAVYFTTGVLKARSTWLAKIETTAAKIETAEKEAKTAKRQFEDARNLVHWENDTWGKAWVAPNSGPAPAADGSIELGAGSNVGIGRGQADPAKLPIVHVFGTYAQGESVYIGDFQLTEVRADSAGAKLTRPAYPNEVESWPRGEYRIRELVPHDNLSAIATLRTLVLLADQESIGDDLREREMSDTRKGFAKLPVQLFERLLLVEDGDYDSDVCSLVVDGRLFRSPLWLLSTSPVPSWPYWP